jgi:hypothetical protein
MGGVEFGVGFGCVVVLTSRSSRSSFPSQPTGQITPGGVSISNLDGQNFDAIQKEQILSFVQNEIVTLGIPPPTNFDTGTIQTFPPSLSPSSQISPTDSYSSNFSSTSPLLQSVAIHAILFFKSKKLKI